MLVSKQEYKDQGGILFFLRGSGVTLVENFARNSVIFDIYSIVSSSMHLTLSDPTSGRHLKPRGGGAKRAIIEVNEGAV